MRISLWFSLVLFFYRLSVFAHSEEIQSDLLRQQFHEHYLNTLSRIQSSLADEMNLIRVFQDQSQAERYLLKLKGEWLTLKSEQNRWVVFPITPIKEELYQFYQLFFKHTELPSEWSHVAHTFNWNTFFKNRIHWISDFMIEMLVQSAIGLKSYGVMYISLTLAFEMIEHTFFHTPFCKLFQAGLIYVLNVTDMHMAFFKGLSSQSFQAYKKFITDLWQYQELLKYYKKFHKVSEKESEGFFEKIKSKISEFDYQNAKKRTFHYFEWLNFPSHLTEVKEGTLIFEHLSGIDQIQSDLKKILDLQEGVSLKLKLKQSWALGALLELSQNYKKYLLRIYYHQELDEKHLEFFESFYREILSHHQEWIRLLFEEKDEFQSLHVKINESKKKFHFSKLPSQAQKCHQMSKILQNWVQWVHLK